MCPELKAQTITELKRRWKEFHTKSKDISSKEEITRPLWKTVNIPIQL